MDIYIIFSLIIILIIISIVFFNKPKFDKIFILTDEEKLKRGLDAAASIQPISNPTSKSAENFDNIQFKTIDDIYNNFENFISIYFPYIDVDTINNNVSNYVEKYLIDPTGKIKITHRTTQDTPNLLQQIIKDHNKDNGFFITIMGLINTIFIYNILLGLSDETSLKLNLIGFISFANLLVPNNNRPIKDNNNNNIIVNNIKLTYSIDDKNNFNMYQQTDKNITINQIDAIKAENNSFNSFNCLVDNLCYINIDTLKMKITSDILTLSNTTPSNNSNTVPSNNNSIVDMINNNKDKIKELTYNIITYYLICMENNLYPLIAQSGQRQPTSTSINNLTSEDRKQMTCYNKIINLNKELSVFKLVDINML